MDLRCGVTIGFRLHGFDFTGSTLRVRRRRRGTYSAHDTARHGILSACRACHAWRVMGRAGLRSSVVGLDDVGG